MTDHTESKVKETKQYFKYGILCTSVFTPCSINGRAALVLLHSLMILLTIDGVKYLRICSETSRPVMRFTSSLSCIATNSNYKSICIQGNAILAGHVQYPLTDSGERLCHWVIPSVSQVHSDINQHNRYEMWADVAQTHKNFELLV